MLTLNFRGALRYPSAMLLLVQLAGVLLYPLMEQTNESRIYFGVFGVVVLGLTLRMVRATPGAVWIALLLAAAIVLLSVATVVAPSEPLLLTMAALESIFYFHAAGCLIAYMLQDDYASKDEFFACGATFTLLAWAFAYLFVACQMLSPGSFMLSADPALIRSWMELLFLSFTCLSGLGLSDVMPARPMARALVMLEAFVGVMYIALVVSRLIGLSFRAK
jgi:hypothetical protein